MAPVNVEWWWGVLRDHSAWSLRAGDALCVRPGVGIWRWRDGAPVACWPNYGGVLFLESEGVLVLIEAVGDDGPPE